MQRVRAAVPGAGWYWLVQACTMVRRSFMPDLPVPDRRQPHDAETSVKPLPSLVTLGNGKLIGAGAV